MILIILINLPFKFRAPEENVSNLTHLFGALAGLLIGIGVLRNLKVESWEKKLWWAAVLLYLVMITAGIVIHVQYFDYVYDFIKKISFK